MLKIFISSHGHFASGIKSSVEILMGPNSRITVFDAYIDQDSVQEHLDAFYETVGEDDKVLLLSDLYGRPGPGTGCERGYQRQRAGRTC